LSTAILIPKRYFCRSTSIVSDGMYSSHTSSSTHRWRWTVSTGLNYFSQYFSPRASFPIRTTRLPRRKLVVFNIRQQRHATRFLGPRTVRTRKSHGGTSHRQSITVREIRPVNGTRVDNERDKRNRCEFMDERARIEMQSNPRKIRRRRLIVIGRAKGFSVGTS